MRTSCAMMAVSITPPAKEDGAEVDEAVEARGAAVSVRSCLGRSYAALRRMVAATMAHINVKWGDSR